MSAAIEVLFFKTKMSNDSNNGRRVSNDKAVITTQRKKVLLKLIMIGDSGVGKTTIINNYIYQNHRQYRATIGADFLTKEIIIDDTLVTIQLWDASAGCERFPFLGVAFYRGADGCIIVYDKSHQDSFKSVSLRKEECLAQTSPLCPPEEFPFMLLANKYDLMENEKSKDLCEWDVKYDRLTLTIGYCREIEKELMEVSPVHIPYALMNLCCDYIGETSSGESYAEENGMLFYNVYIENVTVDCRNNADTSIGGIHLSQTSQLWLNDCKLMFADTGILVRKSSHLNVNYCEFEEATVAIDITPSADNVQIRNSTFKKCGMGNHIRSIGEDACIQIEDTYGELFDKRDREFSFVKLVCDGNIFEDNYGYPIAERAKTLSSYRDPIIGMVMYIASEDPVYVPQRELYRLSNNILKGYNAKEVKKKKNNIDDANKIYFNDETFKPSAF